MDEKQGSGGAYVCSTCSFRSEVFDAEGVRQSGAVFVPPSLFQGYLDNLRAVDSELSRPAARPWLPASFFFERGLLCVLNCMWPPKSLLAANSRRDCWGGQLGLPRQLLRFLWVIGRPHANRWLTTRLLTLVPRVRACAGISGISFVGVTQEGGDDVRYFVETFQRPLRAVTILADEQGVLTDGYQVDALPSLVT